MEKLKCNECENTEVFENVYKVIDYGRTFVDNKGKEATDYRIDGDGKWEYYATYCLECGAKIEVELVMDDRGDIERVVGK